MEEKDFNISKDILKDVDLPDLKKVSDNFLINNDILDKLELPELKEMTKEEYIKWKEELEKNMQNADVNSSSKKL